VESPTGTPLCERLLLADIETLTARDLTVVAEAVPLDVLARTCRLSGRAFTQRARAALAPELHETFDRILAQPTRATEAFTALTALIRTVCALAEQGAVLGPIGALELSSGVAFSARMPQRCRHTSA
jgi:hypothetical protein